VLYDDRDRIGVRNVFVAVTALAWVVSIWTARATGAHVHARGTNALPAAAGAATNWLLMLTAMMAPVLIQPIQFIRGQGLARRRTRATLLFLAGYSSTWTAAGAVMLSIAAMVHRAGLAPVMPAAVALAFATLVQCSPAKQVCLNQCHARTALTAFGWRADTDVLGFGATYAGWCIGSCGAWMLVPLILAGGHIAAMMAVAVLIFCERLEKPAPPAWHWRGLGTAWRVVVRQVRMRQAYGMPVRTAIAALIIAFLPAAAWAQRVTKVPDGDTLVVDGVGKVHLLGIKSADKPALNLGPSGPAPQPRHDPSTPAPAAVGGRINLTRDRPSRDLLRKLALGKTVRVEYDPLAGTSRDRAAYLFLENGTLLNAEMLKAGRARVDLTRPFVHQQEFKRLEQEAQSASVGIWIR
jgi:predicted metal-binding membrane protein/endonuclease YncB( thermonuclease family)